LPYRCFHSKFLCPWCTRRGRMWGGSDNIDIHGWPKLLSACFDDTHSPLVHDLHSTGQPGLLRGYPGKYLHFRKYEYKCPLIDAWVLYIVNNLTYLVEAVYVYNKKSATHVHGGAHVHKYAIQPYSERHTITKCATYQSISIIATFYFLAMQLKT
jgi:hypothetical protein